VHKFQFNRAKELSSKLGKLITERRSESLSNVNPRSSKELWSSVKPAIKNYHERSSLGTKYGCMFDDVNAINAYFADIACDPHNDSHMIEQLLSSLPRQSNSCFVLFIEYEVFQVLSEVIKTSPGSDQLPYWLFRECVGLLSPVVKHLFNIILPTGTCPASWKRAIVTPIPKINQPTALSDLRHIYFTPILSRLFERLIVRKFILPALPKTLFMISLPFILM
jgi:hypothetical protein